MTHGGARKNAGRKPLPEREKRVMVAVRLPPDVVAWMRAQPESQSALIERLVQKERGG
jgi:uncharacterized protein (DUF4415 family)